MPWLSRGMWGRFRRAGRKARSGCNIRPGTVGRGFGVDPVPMDRSQILLSRRPGRRGHQPGLQFSGPAPGRARGRGAARLRRPGPGGARLRLTEREYRRGGAGARRGRARRSRAVRQPHPRPGCRVRASGALSRRPRRGGFGVRVLLCRVVSESVPVDIGRLPYRRYDRFFWTGRKRSNREHVAAMGHGCRVLSAWRTAGCCRCTRSGATTSPGGFSGCRSSSRSDRGAADSEGLPGRAPAAKDCLVNNIITR